MRPDHARIWTVKPAGVEEDRWRDLVVLLDEAESARAGRFKFEADHRAYVLAHAMRRLLVAQALAVTPLDVIFSSEDNGKPLLLEPRGRKIFFSHSHTRDAAVCVVTPVAPVGIDIEFTAGQHVDFKLLEAFVALPDAARRSTELGPDPSVQFCFYWTAVEAFWKAMGKGLSSNHPRIRCRKTASGLFDIVWEASGPEIEPIARLVPVRAPEGAVCAAIFIIPPRAI